MRYAVKVAYDGTLYHGSQRQGKEDNGSVQGAIEKALRNLDPSGNISASVRFSSRTDAGVFAMGNVFSLETDRDMEMTLKSINSNTEGICCWSWGRLREHQNIRWANSRWYRYHMPPDHYSEQYISDMNRAMMEFIGEHNFRRFCKSREEKNPVVRVERAKVQDLSGSGEMVIIDVIGPRFLWNQVRRMVGTAMKFAEGVISLDDIIELLNTEEDDERIKKIQSKIPLIPSTGLTLMDVHFKDVEFQRSPYAAGIVARRYRERAWMGSMRVLLHTAVRGVARMENMEGREDGRG